MSRGNGHGLGYADRCEAEAAVAEDREGLDFSVRRMRQVRIEIMRLMVGHNQLDRSLELELAALEAEFQHRLQGDESDDE